MSQSLDTILPERQLEYGDAKDSFTRVGRGWGAILNIPDIDPVQVSLMMDFLKTIRVSKNPQHEDSWEDKFGYTKHGLEIAYEHKEAR